MHPQPYAGTPSRPGWYADPWNRSQWRWWDGLTWTMHVSVRAKKPALPGWLSVPVIVASILAVPAVGLIALTIPLAAMLSVRRV